MPRHGGIGPLIRIASLAKYLELYPWLGGAHLEGD